MKSWNEIRKEAEVNMKGIFVLSVVMLCVGCEKHWAMQLADEVNKGLPAEFEDGCLDGYRRPFFGLAKYNVVNSWEGEGGDWRT